MIIKHEFTVRADTASLKFISEKLAVFFSEAGWHEAQTTLYNAQLALNEICANIVRHAYAGHTDGEIYIKLNATLDPPLLEMETRDQGIHFDRDSVQKPELGIVQEHGYGLFLVEELMDKVSYQTAGKENIWQLSLHIEK